jgi:predicted ATPase/signal transduction histidine kinase
MASAFVGYERLENIYSSTRSVIDRARREVDGRRVVIKQAAPSVVAAEASRRVRHEVELLRALRGKGVVEVFDVMKDGGRAAIVLEEFGEALAAPIAARRFPLDEALAVAHQLALVLSRVHAAGIVHRDVNPKNIVYDAATGQVRLIDFDLATSTRGGRTELVAPSSLQGTLHYLSPEQTGRLNRSVDARSDLYSLGVTLYELFTGATPFSGDDSLAIVHAHLASVPARLDTLGLPAAVADIVAKLLEKAPERRYQTALGLAKDLERCRAGELLSFAIGEHDCPTRFELPERLYGRDVEVGRLVAACERTANGAVEVMLVAGPAGIGKSSTVRELYGPISIRHGHFASGKFDQLHRDVPYLGVAAALGELVDLVLADPALDRWRAGVTAAIGEDTAIVAGVVPAITRLVGPVPSAQPADDPAATQRRLAAALSRLLRVFAKREHPLVLFLDDVQWADGASLQLLGELATSEDTEALLVLAAYRDNEVDPAHPFSMALADYLKRGARVSQIAVTPLGDAPIAQLLVDALRCTPEVAAPIAAAVRAKTEGNPFFIRQFLQTLSDDGYIRFDADKNAFVLDLETARGAGIAENVADLLARKLGRLPAQTRAVLPIAAAIGNRFDLATVELVAELSPAALLEALAPAVELQMIVPAAEAEVLGEDVDGAPRFAFHHDRIQEAAYAATPPDARPALHLRIGRQLLASTPADELDGRLFDVVHHLALGVGLLDPGPELDRFVELASAAAARARRSGAFDVAATMLEHVSAVRDPEQHYAVWVRVQLDRGDVLTSAGRHRDARRVVHAALPCATPRDQARLETLDTTICLSMGMLAESLACARRAAALLGMPLPGPGEVEAATGQEIGAAMATIAQTPVDQWLDLPPMEDEDLLAMMTLLSRAIPAAYQVDPNLLVLIGARMVRLSVTHGSSGQSARGYTAFAIVLWVMGEYALSCRIGNLGLELLRRFPAPDVAPAVDFVHAAFTAAWERRMDEVVERLRTAIVTSLAAGDVAHAGYAAVFTLQYRMISGAPLAEVADDSARYERLCRRLGLPELSAQSACYAAHAAALGGEVPPHGEYETDRFERELERTGGSHAFRLALRVLTMERMFWNGDYAAADTLARATAPMVVAVPASAMNAEYRFYACLAALANRSEDASIDAFRADLARYAALCSVNYGPASALVDAEHARAKGDLAAVVAGYDAAIAGAAENGAVKVEIIAHDRAAQLWLELGKPGFAQVHLGKARDLCEHWGAKPRARELELRRRGLGEAHTHHSSSHTTSTVASSLDFAAVVKASHAIASDVVLDSLLPKMMEIIVENTGAQSGAIVLETDGALAVHAVKAPGSRASVVAAGALAAAPLVSEGIARYVSRTGEALVVADAARHPVFRTDPSVRARSLRSVLCAPIVHQDRRLGVVYLENNLVAGAFTIDRLQALGILVGQLAISIENASMFARLEGLVARRTQALTAANQQLREEAVIRERMENELRLAQKLQSVGQLAAGVAHEINTPIQFVGNSIEFVQDALGALLALVDGYRSSIDPVTGRVDRGRVEALEAEHDLEFLRENALDACLRASEGVDRVAKIVRAMKAFAHPDQHEQTPVRLDTLVEDTLVVARSEYRQVADMETSFGDLPEVRCHGGEISQVVLNLVVNAAHAIEERLDASNRRGKISISTYAEGPDVAVIAIKDTGGGIPEAIRERIFDPFFTTKAVGRGTGQGLALARTAIVDRHGGTIDYVTEPGVGTTFYVKLPVAGRVAAPASPVESAAA